MLKLPTVEGIMVKKEKEAKWPFALHPHYDWWYRFPRNVPKNIKGFAKDLRYLKQRALRGYADCDVWGLNEYLMTIIPPMLRQLDTGSHPSELSAEEWRAQVELMAVGFEAMRRQLDGTNWERETAAEVCQALDLKDQKTFEQGLRVFGRYFATLWD